MIADLAIAMFGLAAVAAVVRVVRGPHLADRVIALDVALVALMGSMTAHAAATESTTYLSIVAVVAIVGFTATVSLARFIVAEGEDSDIGRSARPATSPTNPSGMVRPPDVDLGTEDPR